MSATDVEKGIEDQVVEDVGTGNISGIMAAFNPELVYEWEQDKGERLADGIRKTLDYFNRTFTWLKSERNRDETQWMVAENHHSMDSRLKDDANRLSSILRKRALGDSGEADKELERHAVNRPMVHDMVKQLSARCYKRMFGSGPEYVQFRGREENDAKPSDIAQHVMNYQYNQVIPISRIGYNWVQHAFVYGSGFLGITWDFVDNAPKLENVSPWDLWLDPAASAVKDCRFIVWRRTITVGELLQYRVVALNAAAEGRSEGYWFEEKDLYNIAKQEPKKNIREYDHVGKTKYGNSNFTEGNEHHKIVNLDVMLEKGRWIYVVNEKLIVGITENRVPTDADGRKNYPIVAYTPLPKANRIIGESIAYQLKDLEDVNNSISYMMHANLARNALGLVFYDKNKVKMNPNKIMRSGYAYPVDGSPGDAIMQLQFPDIGPTCMRGMEYNKSDAELVTGVNASVRGSQEFSGQTATGTQALINEAAVRMDVEVDMGLESIRILHSLMLIYNQTYLSELYVDRLIGSNTFWTPSYINGQDMFGAVGKDIIPTGFPLAGSKTFLSQQGFNIAAQIGNLGGNPWPIMRQTLNAMGIMDTDNMFPNAEEPGHDPDQENAYMLEGKPVSIHPNDDDIKHYFTHISLNDVPDALMAMMNNPQVFQGITLHVQQHEARLQGQGYDVSKLQGQNKAQGAKPDNTNGARPKPQSELDNQLKQEVGQHSVR